MTQTTIAKSPPNRIWISRDWSRYTYRRYENNTLTAVELITAARAKEIIEANPNGRQLGHEPVTFDGFGGQFTYEIDLEVSDGD